MTIAIDRSQEFHREPRRRGMPLTLLGFNLVALAAVVGPAWLILQSACAQARFSQELLDIVMGLFALGVVSCVGSMLMMVRPRDKRQGLVLLLPIGFAAFAIALGLLIGASN